MEQKHIQNKDTGELLQLVTFRIENEEYGVDILHVQEIIRMIEITKMPNTSEHIDGVINLRGTVIAVMDLRQRFGLEKKERDNHTRIMVVNLSGIVMGFIVDAVSEVLRIPSGTVDPPPTVIESGRSEYISGVGKLHDRLLILVDLEKVIGETEIENLRRMELAA